MYTRSFSETHSIAMFKFFDAGISKASITEYALNALVDNPLIGNSIDIVLGSPVNPLVVDHEGNKLGIDESGQFWDEIPGASFAKMTGGYPLQETPDTIAYAFMLPNDRDYTGFWTCTGDGLVHQDLIFPDSQDSLRYYRFVDSCYNGLQIQTNFSFTSSQVNSGIDNDFDGSLDSLFLPTEIDTGYYRCEVISLVLPGSWSSSWLTDPRGTVRAYVGNCAGDYTAGDIDPATILLNDEVPIYGGRYRIRPSMTGFDGSVLEISFSRQLAVQSLGEDAETGTHTVTITGEFTDGNKFISEVEITLDGTPPAKIEAQTDQPTVPTDYSLGNAYPNPFNPTTTIEFGVPSDGNVRIEVYNITGQKVKTLTNQYYTAGSYTIDWNSTDDSGNEVATGVYLYRMTASDFVETKKMVLMK